MAMTSRLWRLLPAFFLLFQAAVPAQADETPPDAATIREHVRVARAMPSEYRMTMTTSSSDGTTTITRYAERDGAWRAIVEHGPFHSEYGKTAKTEWHQNENGQTVVDEPEPDTAQSDPVTTSVTRVHAPVEAWLLSDVNKLGYGTRTFVDPTTWQILRRETVRANGTVAISYDDFRNYGTRVFANHWTTDDGYARTRRETRVTAYEPREVPPDAVAMPASRRSLVQFPAGAKSVTLPAKFGHQHVIVRIMVGTRGLDFLLDTGADGITLDNGVIHELGLPVYEQHSAVTAQRYTTGRSIVPEMRIGDLVMRDVAVDMVPTLDEIEPGYKAVGLLGYDFLKELGITIDYEKKTVTVVREPDYVPPQDPRLHVLEVRTGDGSPYTEVKINGVPSERFILDTGGAGTFMIFDAFARRHPEALVDMGGGSYLREVQYYGVGGAIETRPYQLASVKVGTLNFHNYVGFRVTSAKSYDVGGVDGIIGTDFLRMFTVGLDYANDRVYLVPNAAGRKAMGLRE